jgi:hypothetical protein
MLLVCGLAEPSVRKAGQQLVNDPLERITLEWLQGRSMASIARSPSPETRPVERVR